MTHMQQKAPPYVDRSGGTTMHRERDARRESPHRIPQDVRRLAFDEELLVPRALLGLLDLDRLRVEGWFPLSMRDGRARVAAVNPEDPAVAGIIRRTLGVDHIDFLRIAAADLDKTIANNEDVNPGFPGLANRTSLAKVRTYLANRRSFLASRRTVFAKGRTGLAMLRTGLAFATAILLLLRIAGFGFTSLIELCLLAAGLFLVADGLLWYLPARRLSRRRMVSGLPEPTGGISVLFAILDDFRPVFGRTAPVPGAEALRDDWDALSPVMRRRFLALDRTDLAEERTLLAFFRTLMAKSRTGMALGRTGVALAGIGIALVRQYSQGDGGFTGWALIALGLAMTLEGLSWYLPGRKAGRESVASTGRAEAGPSPWSLVLPPQPGEPGPRRRGSASCVQGGAAPGIWGSTGLALERTLLAERRNVMARLRTHMARARTGLAFIRTGMNFSAVGLGLLVTFGLRGAAWAALEAGVLGLGVLLVIDGLYWYLPADRIRRGLPYCHHGLDIVLPDYTQPVANWPHAEFENGR
jgi:uncharacterized membrane protein YidH (DUF202 family)